jgi:hypothetical protein
MSGVETGGVEVAGVAIRSDGESGWVGGLCGSLVGGCARRGEAKRFLL